MKYNYIIILLIVIQSCGHVDVTKKFAVVDKQVSCQHVLSDRNQGAYLSLDKMRYDFGKINRGKTPHISIDFEVENLGKTPLLIIKADVSCGCLSVEYPKAPIRPGEKSKLTVNVDTKAQAGIFDKNVFIKSNADNDVEFIRITGEVKK